MNKKTIYYWSPHLTEIATAKAVINSAYSLNKFFKNFETYIIDSIGEFSLKSEELQKKKINLIKLNTIEYINFLPKYGKFKSRISFIIIFLINFFPLAKLLKRQRPDFLIIHLITSLPLILFYIFNFETKCILRISGFPLLGTVRKFFWKIFLKKVYIVTCPTINTLNYMKSLNIVDHSKLKLLYDPIINVSEIIRKKKEQVEFKNYAIAAGRLTGQKNFIFLINNFKKIIEIDKNFKLLIIGNGEEKNKLQSRIDSLNLSKNIILLPFKDNIFPYIANSKCFFLSSKWEDPGFVLIESAFCRSFIISSNCPNGPKEIIDNNTSGLLYNSGDESSFLEKISLFSNMSVNEIQNMKKNALKKSKLFTIFFHAKTLAMLLRDN
jgi:glycosyltransferase involved in cell wall biosynthesis